MYLMLTFPPRDLKSSAPRILLARQQPESMGTPDYDDAPPPFQLATPSAFQVRHIQKGNLVLCIDIYLVYNGKTNEKAGIGKMFLSCRTQHRKSEPRIREVFFPPFERSLHASASTPPAPRPSFSAAYLTVNANVGRERQAKSRHDPGFGRQSRAFLWILLYWRYCSANERCTY